MSDEQAMMQARAPDASEQTHDLVKRYGTRPRRQHAAGQRSRDAIVARCRELMAGGRFVPKHKELTGGTIGIDKVIHHFPQIGDLWEIAIDDEPTRTAVLSKLMPNGPWPASEDCARIIRAVLWGRLSQ